jgi:hypothetical protein
MATDRADAVCSANGQAPVNRWSATSWILPGINPQNHFSTDRITIASWGIALGCNCRYKFLPPGLHE